MSVPLWSWLSVHREYENGAPDTDLVTVFKCALTYRNIVHVRSIRAIQIAKCELFAVLANHTVLPRNSAVEHQGESITLLTPDAKIAFRERKHSAFV
jgi:hypothetical protein